ncbi:hypothetical protein MHW47_00140 [Streptomyces sp. OfavH-34-F]|uniref:hypothetical protein n=1 Tax=Streptomyces sp. OfavH-34-F TaxID=2917760 RepID=UPI001EF165D2|nr:hypothetical protein [Streptomyces sp. OfavH-34-F]MCG7522864.1 hypothetical protein [Streptomyces sp. OfavH-34-F]
MNEEIPDGLRPRPFGGDMERWRSETERAARYQTAGAEPLGAAFQPPEAVRTVERTPWGWIRWGYPIQTELRFDDAFPAEIGVFAPEGRKSWRAVAARTVPGRRPAPTVRQLGAADLPVAVSVSCLALLVAAVLLLTPVLDEYMAAGTFLLVAGAAGIALAWGVPAVLALATRRHVRILDAAVPHAGRVHRLLALQQAVSSAAAAADIAELRRAARVGHRFLWDGLGLVLAADGHGAELEVVEVYEAAYLRLHRASVHALAEQERLEGTLTELDAADEDFAGPPGAYRGNRRSRLVEEAMSSGDEITEELDVLAAGLRHAQHTVGRVAGPLTVQEVRHEGR